MSSIQAIQPDTGIVLDDGEVLPLDQVSLDLLAAFVDGLRDEKQKIDGAMRLITGELCRRADFENTTQIGGNTYVVTVDGPGNITRYDSGRLANVIELLVLEQVISLDAANSIIRHESKIDTYALKRACKNPKVAEAVREAITSEEPKQRRVKVEPR